MRAAGIREITGEVIVDYRLFSPSQSTGSGPRMVSPIVINDNMIDVFVQPAAKAGEPALVTFQPATQFVTMDAQVTTVDAGVPPMVEVHPAGPRRFIVRGRLPLGHPRVVKIYEVDEPASFARAFLIESGTPGTECELPRRPLDVTISSRSCPAHDEVAKLPRVAEYTSPPFGEYLRVILKVSHNLHASTLPLLLAARHGERTLRDGLKREGTILKSLGVEPGTISFGGGAGGDRARSWSRRARPSLLLQMAARPDFAAYDTALPILGRDGTLAKAVGNDSPVRGHVHAKTGTFYVENDLNDKAVLTSKALAGYLETASGRSLVLAAFVNNVPLDAPRPDRPVSEATAEAGRLLGTLCEVLYADSGDAAPSSAQEGTPTREKSGSAR